MTQLKDIAHYVTEKVEVTSLSSENYISTENMLKDKQGATFDASLPDAAKVTKFSVGDVLVSNIRPYFKKIYQADRNGGCSNDVIVFRTNDDNVYRQSFLFYVLSQDYFFDYMTAGSNGTKMPRGNKKLIPLFPVPDFTIAEQDKIVNLLADYDKLIENCQKQIALLEEAALRTYNELSSKLTEDDFQTSFVTDVLEIKYGKDHKPLENGVIPVYGSGGIMRRVNKALCNGESVLIPRKGTLNNIMYVNGAFWTIDTMFYSIPKIPHVAKYMYLLLSSQNMSFFNIGAAVPSMTTQFLSKMEFKLPNQELLSNFEQQVAPLFQLKQNFEKQIETLREARDILLPRLISGEITI